MSRLTETLIAAGWVETTLGECRVEEEVLLTPDGPFPRAVRLVQPPEWGGEKRQFVNTSDGGARLGTLPVLRPPRPEYAPGTVALITWDEVDDHVRDLLPVRAMMDAEGAWRGAEVFPPRSLDRIEVVRVLLPAEQDTPSVEVTDEMVERAAEARYLASYEGPGRGRRWGKVCEAFPDAVAIFRREARAALEAALGVEK